MREGSLEAPVRHPLAWQEPEFYDQAALDAELRRVFDICHGCRRCFNLCDSFPRLFDLIDESESGELDTVSSDQFGPVIDACTLCDMCFMTKCPYVPPHEFNLDFPHLMLRARAIEARAKGVPWTERELAKTDRNGVLGGLAAPLANWATRAEGGIARAVMESKLDVDRRAELPKFHGKAFTVRTAQEPPELNREAPAFGRKAVLYATCFVNYHNPPIGEAARAVLAHNGVETAVEHPRCCGMPQLEQGNIEKVVEAARSISAALLAYVDRGYDVVSLVPSCSLMLKFEWPLLAPDDADLKRLAQATFDLSEYVVDIARREGLAPGLKPLEGGVAVHLACHARAQNMGPKAAELLRLIPDLQPQVIERCSGHGGSWGVRRENFETALKVGLPAGRQALKVAPAHLVSECPLAAPHLLQTMQGIAKPGQALPEHAHPIELFARAYGLVDDAGKDAAP